MRRRQVVASGVAALIVAAGWLPAKAAPARLHDVYFARSVPVTGRNLSRQNLPQKTSTFEVDKDPDVFLIAILDGPQGARFRAELRAPSGETRQAEWTLADSPGASWRFATRRFPTASLEGPGEYAVTLVVDDVPSGTYLFRVK